MATILTVEDSKAVRYMVSSILTKEGHKVLEAECGADALDIARSQGADIVITDLNMPRMSGNALVTKLRRLEQYENVPILILTTESASSKKTMAKKNGANGWISKPVTAERLISAVNSVLTQH